MAALSLSLSLSKDDSVDSPVRQLLADVLSILAMTVDDQKRECLQYRLQGTYEKVESFGHPYIRRLCFQIPQEWNSGGMGMSI